MASTLPSPGLDEWRRRVVAKWLEEVRSLSRRRSVDNGRRPKFKTGDGCYTDCYTWHVLAYFGDRIGRCVRVYPLAGNRLPVSLLQRFRKQLSLGRHRNNAIEIGRWVVDPRRSERRGALRRASAYDSAAAGAIALALVNQSGGMQMQLVSAGSRDNQHRMLSAHWLEEFSGINL